MICVELICFQIILNSQKRDYTFIMKYLTSCLRLTNSIIIDKDGESQSQIQSNAQQQASVSVPIMIPAKPHISKFCRITPIRRVPMQPPIPRITYKIQPVQLSEQSQSEEDSMINKNFKRESEVNNSQGAKIFKRRLVKVANKCKIERKQYSSTECSICLGSLEAKDPDEIGRLPCKHSFCFDCIYQSSKFCSRCPYCRAIYKHINKNYELIPVQQKDLEEDFDPYEQPCYVCGRNNDFDHLLECEYCEAAFCHTYCDTRLESDDPPEESWYCLSCSSLLGN